MTAMLIGLFGFLALHSIRIVAPAWREARIAAMGANTWKGIYSVLSIASFALLVWGFGQARMTPELVWSPPSALRHGGSLLVLVAFVLFVAANVPRNAIKAKLQHPMTLGTKLWAFAHLLMSGWLHMMIVSGAFLLWAIVLYANVRRRGVVVATTTASAAMTALTVVIGLIAWALFAFWLHALLIGRAPFG